VFLKARNPTVMKGANLQRKLPQIFADDADKSIIINLRPSAFICG
jgi:hypothetical protein